MAPCFPLLIQILITTEHVAFDLLIESIMNLLFLQWCHPTNQHSP